VQAHSHAFTVYWTWWAVAAFLGFLGPEVYALVTNWQNSLSANIWRMEDFIPGQRAIGWSAGHFLFVGVLILLDVWLLGHFGWGLWK